MTPLQSNIAPKKWKGHLCFMAMIMLLAGCATSKKGINKQKSSVSIAALKFLDVYEIPFKKKIENTWVGGLSGIDYDKKLNLYYVISDERSETSASRFYTCAIDINDYKINSIQFISVVTLKNPQQDSFARFNISPEHAADPESIRFNPKQNTLVWSSEGSKATHNGRVIYQNSWIYEMDLNGYFKDSFLIPTNLLMYKGDSGARSNNAIEGLSFTTDYKYLWASMEGTIYEDGPHASATYANAPARFTKFNHKTKKAVSQFGYLLDAVAAKPLPDKAFSVNGISENLYIGHHRFLVLERSFSSGIASCVIKIYLADFSAATDISHEKSLYQNNLYRPASKKLLFNFNSLNQYIDNVEGITIGPTLPNGHQSLIIIADNNFNKLENSRFFYSK